jgi:alkanesulfonate monooxygenase SsuD/methylene tetrahydromethanopterin reductase-like flavin-dependent oxidoreductase (luciferase family)
MDHERERGGEQGDCGSARSPHGAQSAFTRVFDALWRNAGIPDFASLHPGYNTGVGEHDMKFGLFGSAQAKRGGADIDSAQGFRDFIDYNVEAEALGYDSTFVVEHHFTGFGQVSASLNLLTYLAARTSTLRLGTAVMVLPWHNPVLLAEAAATIDLLSGGRLEFGVGKGYRHNEFSGFCIDIAEADARFEESLGLILKSWTSNERFSHHGKFWNFENIVVEPPTKQKPHPPIWMAAGQPDSIRKVAQRGAKLLLDQFASVPATIERFNIYKAEVEAQGRRFDRNDVGVARAFYVAKDADDKAKAVEQRLANQKRMTELAAAPGAVKSSMLSFDYTLDAAEESAMFGTPDEIAAKLERLRAAGITHVLLNGGGGSVANLRRFAHEVMPAFAGEKRAAAE